MSSAGRIIIRQDDLDMTLSERIYEELYRDITSGKLKAGQKLTLQMLKEQFQVSHTPIREALTRLAEDGLVTYYTNLGCNVATFSEEEIYQLYQFLGELGSIAIRFCANAYSTTPLLFALQENREQSRKFFAEKDLLGWQRCSDGFHQIFFDFAHNQYLTHAWKKLHAKIDVLTCNYLTWENSEWINSGLQKITDFCLQNDFDSAAEAMKEYIQYSMIYAQKTYLMSSES